ncbi:hypothetical protein JTB14_027498 [Gonioctena quinquepunctata]|nr:hypothetical protein JTB14_027498 [Gonioctena quinquepunctata]
MSRRSSKMMMALAQKNMSLRDKIKVSEKLKRNIQNIDPDFFPSSDDSNDDFPLSRPVSAKQYFAENNHNIIIPNVGFSEDYITLEPSTSKIETVNKIQDNQNSENWDNISIKSSDLLASGSSAISEYNINPTDGPSSITCSNIAGYYYNNENVTNAIPIMSIGEEQNLSYHQLLPVVPENDNQEIITNSSTVDNVDSACAVLLKTNDEEILHTTDSEILHIDNKETITQENEQIRVMNTTQNDEMNKENSVALKTYTKTGTSRPQRWVFEFRLWLDLYQTSI